VVVFLHIPKCGGTSLHEWLGRHAVPGTLSPERHRLPDIVPAERVRSMQAHRVFSGHFDALDLRHFPRPQHRFTVFRDPVDRIVSLYDFWRAHYPDRIEADDLIGPRLASSMTFEEFLTGPDRRIVPDLDNTIVRTFTGLIRSSEPFEDAERSLAEATRLVASLDHVGHVERLEDTASWLGSEFGVEGPVDLARVNVRGDWDEAMLRNVERTVLSDTARELIEPLVALDRRLIDQFTG
jgi:hypothetical protein